MPAQSRCSWLPRLTVRFRERLTQLVHERYCHGTRYYRAATLRSKGLDHLDQRVADDVHQFCATLAYLHGRTFKPALDAVLCTHRMPTSSHALSQLA